MSILFAIVPKQCMDKMEFSIQVCYIGPNLQFLKTLNIKEGTTILQAIRESGVLKAAPEINLANCRVGIFNKLKGLDALLQQNDRVEIYRPLLADPMQKRRDRIKSKLKDNSAN